MKFHLNGIYLKELEVTTRPCKIEKMGKYTFRLILTQGINRQIRRMCEAVDLEVMRLKRTEIAGVKLGMLPQGKWRPLNEREMRHLTNVNAEKKEN